MEGRRALLGAVWTLHPSASPGRAGAGSSGPSVGWRVRCDGSPLMPKGYLYSIMYALCQSSLQDLRPRTLYSKLRSDNLVQSLLRCHDVARKRIRHDLEALVLRFGLSLGEKVVLITQMSFARDGSRDQRKCCTCSLGWGRIRAVEPR